MADAKWSHFPSESPDNADEIVGLHSGHNARFSVANFILAVRQGIANLFVPKTRKVNGKALSSDISLTMDDISNGVTYAKTTAAQVAQIGTNEADIDAIEGKIPSAASTSNQLADKDFVTDSITQGTAIFRGSFASKAALLAVQWQTTNPSGANYVSNNDYAVVLDDESQNDECWRYIYVTGTGWTPQYRINESPLTQAQLDAINSGATAAIISSVGDKLDKTGDGSNVTATFTAASTRANISTGEKLSVMFGKIAKWFADLGTAAFRAATGSITSGSTDLVESGAVYTGLSGKQPTITASGILKGDGAGGVTAATPGTDYQSPLTAGTDYATPAQLADKANQSQLAYVETSTTASRAYALGDYFCLNGYLRKATTAISQGATITNNNSTQIAGGGMSVLAESRLFKQIGAWNSGSKTIAVPRGYGPRFYVFGSAVSAYNAFLIASSDGSGNVQYTPILQGTGISFSTGTGTLTVTLQSSGNTVAILEMPFSYDRYSTVS